MKKYNVQPRICDGGKKYENYVDRYLCSILCRKNIEKIRAKIEVFIWAAV